MSTKHTFTFSTHDEMRSDTVTDTVTYMFYAVAGTKGSKCSAELKSLWTRVHNEAVEDYVTDMIPADLRCGLVQSVLDVAGEYGISFVTNILDGDAGNETIKEREFWNDVAPLFEHFKPFMEMALAANETPADA